MRSCYSSNWRLYKDREDILTPGQYVFAPPNTPFYPGWHNLGSRNWTSDEREPQPKLGEDNLTKHKWHNGSSSGAIAPPHLIGDAICIKDGETEPNPEPDNREFLGGFNTLCWNFPDIPIVPQVYEVDARDCHFQRMMAQVLDLTYQDTMTAATAYLQSQYPAATITSVPNTNTPPPGTLIATIGTTTLVIISGTTVPQQWALQGFSGLVGMVDFGYYSTLLAWEIATTVIARRLTAANPDPAGRIVLVGHSYGGAVASILTARLRHHSATRDLHLLTMGSPRPGDERLARLLDSVTEIHLVNSNDPIAFLPPGGTDIVPFAILATVPFIRRWVDWRHPRNRIGLNNDGSRTDNPSEDVVYGILFRLVLQIVSGETPEVFYAHLTREYLRRIVCPGEPVGPVHVIILSKGMLHAYGTTKTRLHRHKKATGMLYVLGSSKTYLHRHKLSTGIVHVLGDSVVTYSVPLVLLGEIHVSGEGKVKVIRHLLATGEVDVSGDSVISRKQHLLASGEVDVSGDSDVSSKRCFVPEGLLDITGTSVWSGPYRREPVGDIDVSGTSTQRYRSPEATTMGNVTSGQPTLFYDGSGAASISVGMEVFGFGLPDGTTVTAINPFFFVLTLSNNATDSSTMDTEYVFYL